MKRTYLIIFTLLSLVFGVLAAPPNSINLGNTWMCQNGYKKVGESCQKIYVPENAIAVGSDWVCQNGFKKIGNECKQINVPKNAIAVGDRWQCKPVFKRSGSKCVEKTYIELVKTINWLVIKAYSDSCDNFERSCKSNCNTYECASACDSGKSECESELSNACDDARSSCESECGSIDSYDARSACDDACSSGESSCD